MPKIRIGTKILAVFLGLFLVSFLLLGYVAVSSIEGLGDYCLDSSILLGGRAVNDSTTALENQAEAYLLRLANDQAAISNTLFEKVESETNVMTMFASALWSNPPSSGYRRSHSQEEEPDDIYASSVYKLAPEVAVDTVRAELDLSSIMDEIFIPIHVNDPNIDLIYIATESGIHRRYPWGTGYHPTYDPRKRGWYQRAVETGKIGWSGLYIGASTHELMVTCSKPVYGPEGELLGVVGADVTLKAMNEDIINTQIGKLGYAFLIDNNGNFVARPGLSVGDKKWDESFETENLLLSDNTELSAIAEDMIAGNMGCAKCRFEDGEKYIAYAPITCANWSVGIVMPVDEITASTLTTKSKIISATQDTGEYINRQINNMQKSFTVIFIIILLAVFGLTLLLARLITKPILALKRGSEVIGGGDLDYRVEVKTGDELEELANSFNRMASDLKRHTKELVEKETRIRELEIERLEKHSRNLERKVKLLEIKVDREKTEKAVSKITETEYFKKLRTEAADIREKRKKA